MKTTYVFINPVTNELISKEGCNEYFARYSNPVVPSYYKHYQTIIESEYYIRTVTYNVNSIYWQEILHIEHINKNK